MARKISVELVADESDLLRAFSRSAKAAKKFNTDIGRIGRGVAAGSGAFGSLGRSIAFASGAFLGGAGLVTVMRAAFGEMADAQKATAQTNAALASTAGIANVTAKHVDELATSLLNLSGVDDEVIKGAENMLLTFTNIRNEVGKGNDIFDQATKAALDLSVATGTDLKKSALQVGKALQDPVRGITALRRVGVQFTDAQQKQIKALVESGHALEAQKIILRELAVEFGGSAKAAGDTLPGKLNILKESALNLAGTLAAILTPSITHLVDRLIKWVTNSQNQQRVTETFRNAVKQLGDAARTAANLISGLVDALGGWKDAITLAIGAWVGFKLAGVGASTAVLVANIAAARGTAAAWKAALISTGWGALAVAAGIAATEIIAHWETVKNWFKGFWLWLQEGFDRAFLKIVEIPSHFPGGLGGWARDLKKQLQQDITDLQGMFTQLQETASKGPAAKAATTPATAAVPGLGGLTGRIPGGAAGAAAAAAAKAFTLPFRFQLEQARAEATGVQAQIVKAAHDIAVFIAGIIPKLRGKKLLDAYQQFAQADGVVRDAIRQATEKTKETAAKAKQTAEAAAARATAEAELAKQFSVPLGLQVMQARAAALGKSLRPILKQIRAAAEKALKSGKLGLQGQLDAWNTIAEINQQLADHATNTKRVVKAAQVKGFGAVLPTTPSVLGAIVPGTASGFQIHELHLHGVQNVPQLENELLKRSKQRPQPRRGP